MKKILFVFKRTFRNNYFTGMTNADMNFLHRMIGQCWFDENQLSFMRKSLGILIIVVPAWFGMKFWPLRNFNKIK
jgi:hypothetical protein